MKKCWLFELSHWKHYLASWYVQFWISIHRLCTQQYVESGSFTWHLKTWNPMSQSFCIPCTLISKLNKAFNLLHQDLPCRIFMRTPREHLHILVVTCRIFLWIFVSSFSSLFQAVSFISSHAFVVSCPSCENGHSLFLYSLSQWQHRTTWGYYRKLKT